MKQQNYMFAALFISIIMSFSFIAPVIAQEPYPPPPDSQYPPPPDSTTTQPTTYICPFGDGLQFGSLSELEAHIQSAHQGAIPTVGDFVPPEQWVPPTGDWGTWVPDENYVPPSNWTPTAGWVPPENWMADQWVPSTNWVPPTGWVPPTDWMPPAQENWVVGDWRPPENWQAEFTPGADYRPPEWLVMDNYWAPSGTWSPPTDWAPPENWIPPDADDWRPMDWRPPENWRPDFVPSSDWKPPEWIISENNWMPTGEWAPPPDWVPPTNWVPPDMDDWRPPENWVGPQQWQANFAPPEDWKPPEWILEHNSWLPQENWVIPEDWRPPGVWRPPVNWRPPENMMGMIVPPWMPEDSWKPWENWSPNDEWVPPENWRPPEFFNFVCPGTGEEFNTPEEFEAHWQSVMGNITRSYTCPFNPDHGTFNTPPEMEAHIRSEHPDDAPTPDQIPDYIETSVPGEFLQPPAGWETYQLPPLENIPYFVPPWLNPEENHWVPPENMPFWTWELDNIEPGEQVNIYIAEDASPVVNTGEGAWVEDPTAIVGEEVLVGGIQINISTEIPTEILSMTLQGTLENVVTTVQNLDALPAGTTAPDEPFYDLFQVGTNVPEYVDNAEVGVKVDKDWVTTNGMDGSTLTIEHYDGDTWTELPTTVTGEDENYYYLSATTESFSVFAVTGAQLPTQPIPVAIPVWVMVIAAIALVGVLVAVIWRYLSHGGAGPSKSMKRLESGLRRHQSA